jgi:DNA-binding CsgD family transcriptional regulator
MGDHEHAAHLADADVAEARAFGAGWALGLALRTAGELAGGDRGIQLLREAAGVLDAGDAALERAHVLASLGDALLAERHRVAAREPLRQALELAHRCGAEALEQRVRAALVATGARPRRADISGRDALTPRELRIARMARDGMGNREIAETLFITRKTVETHLGHAFRKLGVSSRDGLAATLGTD